MLQALQRHQHQHHQLDAEQVVHQEEDMAAAIAADTLVVTAQPLFATSAACQITSLATARRKQ